MIRSVVAVLVMGMGDFFGVSIENESVHLNRETEGRKDLFY